MKRFLTAVAASIAVSTPMALAEPVDGAGDPAFMAAIDLALTSDDPAAVASLRDLAEAGNLAALVARPFALQWIPPKGTLAEKNAQRKVNGLPAKEAAAKAHPASAAWDMGLNDTPINLVDRAASLSALAEPEKAALLTASWVNQTGGIGTLPDNLLTPATPAWIGALALTFRIGMAEPSPTDHDLLAALLADDNPSAWMALVFLTDRLQRSLPSLGDPLLKAKIPAETATNRLDRARALIEVSPSSWRETPVSAASAALAREALAGRIELAPVTGLCRTHCPASQSSCETAVLTYPGLLFGHFEAIQPFTTILSADSFYATDRGLAAMIRQRRDPTAAEDRATAEGLDACYADLLARRDAVSLVP